MSESGLVFVLGTGRCGSSLVHEVLARHPGAGFVSNIDDLTSHDLPAGLQNRVYRRLSPEASRKGRVRLAPSEGYRVLAREVSPLLATPFRDLRASDVTPWMERRLRAFFAARAERQGAGVFVHKFTGWPRSEFLQRIFPEARFINVVRDGRAVANSWLQMPWWLGYQGPDHWQWGPLPPAYAQEWERSDGSFVVLAGILWKLLMDAYAEARDRATPGSWLDVRYEDVVADPAGTCARMLEFSSLPRSQRFDAGLRRYTFSGSRSDAFRRDLEGAQLAALEQSLGDHLPRWGYPA